MTTKKDLYQYRIFKAYSMLVSFDGEPHRENVPSPIDGETFENWKSRVLGDEVKNVKVFSLYKPTPRTRIKTIQGWSNMATLERTFNALAGEKKNLVKKEIAQTKIAVERMFLGFSQDTLNDLLDGQDDLQPAVREFFERFLDSTDEDIDTENMLRLLLEQFNSNAALLHTLKAKISKLEASA